MNKSKNAISEDEAIRICKEIREKNKGKKISFSK